jgi:cytochrome d ubiquinol oxidase subunit I
MYRYTSAAQYEKHTLLATIAKGPERYVPWRPDSPAEPAPDFRAVPAE